MEYLSSLRGASYFTSSYSVWLLNVVKTLQGMKKWSLMNLTSAASPDTYIYIRMLNGDVVEQSRSKGSKLQ